METLFDIPLKVLTKIDCVNKFNEPNKSKARARVWGDPKHALCIFDGGKYTLTKKAKLFLAPMIEEEPEAEDEKEFDDLRTKFWIDPADQKEIDILINVIMDHYASQSQRFQRKIFVQHHKLILAKVANTFQAEFNKKKKLKQFMNT